MGFSSIARNTIASAVAISLVVTLTPLTAVAIENNDEGSASKYILHASDTCSFTGGPHDWLRWDAIDMNGDECGPTIYQPGKEYRECNDCGEFESRTVPKKAMTSRQKKFTAAAKKLFSYVKNYNQKKIKALLDSDQISSAYISNLTKKLNKKNFKYEFIDVESERSGWASVLVKVTYPSLAKDYKKAKTYYNKWWKKNRKKLEKPMNQAEMQYRNYVISMDENPNKASKAKANALMKKFNKAEKQLISKLDKKFTSYAKKYVKAKHAKNKTVYISLDITKVKGKWQPNLWSFTDYDGSGTYKKGDFTNCDLGAVLPL